MGCAPIEVCEQHRDDLRHAPRLPELHEELPLFRVNVVVRTRDLHEQLDVAIVSTFRAQLERERQRNGKIGRFGRRRKRDRERRCTAQAPMQHGLCTVTSC